VRIYKDRIEKRTFSKSKQIQWNNVAAIFDEISTRYPKRKSGHIIIYSINNDTKIRVDSYMNDFDQIQTIVGDKSCENIKNIINKKLCENQRVDFFYSNFSKIAYTAFVITTSTLVTLPIFLKSLSWANVVLQIILLRFLIEGVIGFFRSLEVLELGNDEISKLTIFNRTCYRLHDIRRIYIKGKEHYKSVATIIFRNNKKFKIDSKISNYSALLACLGQKTNLPILGKQPDSR
jgi:hypothetical protein